MTESEFPNHPYLPHTDADRKAMLSAIGKRSFEELLSHIPASVRSKELDLPEGLSESELYQRVAHLAAKNKPTSSQASFLGGGSYRRYVPAIVPAVISRSEYSTAYTPYQAEASQGSLQAIYEFQTAICLLTQMDVANASMYDGPTACAEAALMACRVTGRQTIVLSDLVNPEYKMVTKTYVDSCGLTLKAVKGANGITSLSASDLDEQTACVVIQYPNFFGCLEKLGELAKAVHQKGALLIVVSEPISLGILTPPGAFDADIVVGDAQPCGNFLAYGGPSAGYMACRKEFIRQLPGRLSGATVDNRGQKAYTLTLQTREQHIRRAHATSNICTNQALNALAMLVYLTFLGPNGLHDLAALSMQRAHYLAGKLTAIAGVKLAFEQPFLNEFVITTDWPAEELLASLKEKGILAGLSLARQGHENSILVAVTEMNNPDDLEKYITTMAEMVKSKLSTSNIMPKAELKRVAVT